MKTSRWIRPVMRWAALGLSSTLLVACSTTDSAYELVRQQQEQEAFLQSKEIEHWEKSWTLLDEGFPVRLSGQDSIRGTFVQRHAAMIDQKTEEPVWTLFEEGVRPMAFETNADGSTKRVFVQPGKRQPRSR